MYGHGHPSGSWRPGHGKQRQQALEQVTRAAPLTLHTLVGATMLRRTNECRLCSSSGRARCAVRPRRWTGARTHLAAGVRPSRWTLVSAAEAKDPRASVAAFARVYTKRRAFHV